MSILGMPEMGDIPEEQQLPISDYDFLIVSGKSGEVEIKKGPNAGSIKHVINVVLRAVGMGLEDYEAVYHTLWDARDADPERRTQTERENASFLKECGISFDAEVEDFRDKKGHFKVKHVVLKDDAGFETGETKVALVIPKWRTGGVVGKGKK